MGTKHVFLGGSGRWLVGGAKKVAVLGLMAALGSLLVAASPAVAQVSFSGPTNFGAGDGSFSVAVGDFNADSDPDLAVANFNSDNVSVLLNDDPNDAPVAADDAYTTEEDTPLSVSAPGVLENDSDDDGDTLTAELVEDVDNGTLTLDSDGSFSYEPDENFNGTDSFTYKASDGQGAEDTATVEITVTAVNDAPKITVVAGSSSQSACLSNTRGRVTLKLADVDSNLSALTLSRSSSNTGLVPNANVVFGGSGETRTATITTVSGRTGSSTVTITASDGQANSSVDVTVKAGGNGRDSLTGTGGADLLLGQNGDDTLSALGSSDVLCGARGEDRLSGGSEADSFDGGSGTDTATDFNQAEGDSRTSIP